MAAGLFQITSQYKPLAKNVQPKLRMSNLNLLRTSERHCFPWRSIDRRSVYIFFCVCNTGRWNTHTLGYRWNCVDGCIWTWLGCTRMQYRKEMHPQNRRRRSGSGDHVELAWEKRDRDYLWLIMEEQTQLACLKQMQGAPHGRIWNWATNHLLVLWGICARSAPL